MNTSTNPTAFPWSSPLLEWYAANARALPWRERGDDAYAVWISEIMLQQTTVTAVIPYFQRWMEAFPDIETLAAAPLDDVLLRWAGLGYYARARNIKRASEMIAGRPGRRLPNSVAELLSLPGIGRYTAGAIASIAYGVDAPILDGNVARVLCRLYGLDGDVDSPGVQRELWRLAEAAIPPGAAGDFNQAMMELGALVCLPSSPRCTSCPVRRFCDASASGDPTALPVRARKTKWISVTDCAALIEASGRILLIRRPDHGLWGGLWELPRATLQEAEEPAACARRACAERAGLTVQVGAQFGQVRHVVMNRRMTLLGFTASATSPECVAAGHRDDTAWASPGEIPGLALAAPQRALIEKWLGER